MACSISLDYWFAWPIRKYYISILKIRVPSAIALSMFYSIEKKKWREDRAHSQKGIEKIAKIAISNTKESTLTIQ